MFAKRQSALAVSAGSPPNQRSFSERLAPLRAALKRPPVAVTLSGLLLLLAAAVFVLVLGDPRAGAPSARVDLSRSPAPQVDIPSGMEAFLAGDASFYQSDGTTGDVVLTLPDGATISGNGAPITAPRLAAQPLVAAPIAGLFQSGPEGPLPTIASDGRVPAQAYARPFRADGRPRIALVVGGLGLNAATTQAAIERLPPEVTLSFVPYAENLQGWIDQARAQGHEVMLEMPMEPTGYPGNDPGPYTLLASADQADITGKMNWLLSRATGYFAVTNYLGDRFATSDAGMNTVLTTLRQRGVAFVDDGTMSRRPGAWARASANRILDEERSAEGVFAQLTALEALARSRGQAMGSGFSYPVTIEALARWTANADARGFQLAPASAMTQRPGR